jgi:hypothetical protein
VWQGQEPFARTAPWALKRWVRTPHRPEPLLISTLYLEELTLCVCVFCVCSIVGGWRENAVHETYRHSHNSCYFLCAHQQTGCSPSWLLPFHPTRSIGSSSPCFILPRAPSSFTSPWPLTQRTRKALQCDDDGTKAYVVSCTARMTLVCASISLLLCTCTLTHATRSLTGCGHLSLLCYVLYSLTAGAAGSSRRRGLLWISGPFAMTTQICSHKVFLQCTTPLQPLRPLPWHACAITSLPALRLQTVNSCFILFFHGSTERADRPSQRTPAVAHTSH